MLALFGISAFACHGGGGGVKRDRQCAVCSHY